MRRNPLAPQAQTLFTTSAVGYTRGHMGDKAGPGPQRERLTAFCAWNTPPLHTIIDEAPEMALTPVANRSGGADMLTLLRARVSTVVIIDTLDRLFPTLAECLMYIEAWTQQGIMLRVLDLGGETLSVGAGCDVLFRVTLGACLAMNHPGRRTRPGKRHAPQGREKGAASAEHFPARAFGAS